MKHNKKHKDFCEYCGTTKDLEYIDYEDCMGLAVLVICMKCLTERLKPIKEDET